MNINNVPTFNKKVLFFFENDWAFGQIHNALAKRLYQYKIYCHVLDWRTSYSHQEFLYLQSKFDAIVTVPSVIDCLISYDVPLSKVIGVAHHEKDIILGLQKIGNRFEELLGYGVIHKHLVEVSAKAGIKRIPKIVPNGLDFDYFYNPVKDKLEIVGYAGAITSAMSDSSEFKRSYLISPIINKTNLTLKLHNRMHHLCMGGYYQSVDSILVTSKYEGCGLPAMEAAAAGRLVLGAKVGCFDGSAGLLCRTPDEEFITDAIDHLERCKDPAVYKEHCERFQQYARDHYDWSQVVNNYVDLLS